MHDITFRKFDEDFFADCVALFDENCPSYFADNERDDYMKFLSRNPPNYFVGVIDRSVVAAFGLSTGSKAKHGRISWIMVSTKSQAHGVGTKMMQLIKTSALEKNLTVINIAASHLSAPFFSKFGATKLRQIRHGWGKNMHRIDMQIRYK